MSQILHAAIFGFALFLLGVSTAHATTTFKFDLHFEQGPEADNIYTGTFSVDPYLATGAERFAPLMSDFPYLTGTLLDFSIEIGSITHIISDALGYPDIPRVGFYYGDFSEMLYRTSRTSDEPDLYIFADEVADALCTPDLQDCGSNTVIYRSIGTDSTTKSEGYVINVRPVPLPASLPLFSFGFASLAGLGVTRRKKI